MYHKTMKEILFVFVGGGTGSVLRYGVQVLCRHLPFLCPFPWATFIVNVAGCFLIGMFYVWSDRFHLSNEVRLLLTTGLCGGFTTFSTFCNEGVGLLKSGAYIPFACYVLMSVLLGLVAVAAGVWVSLPAR